MLTHLRITDFALLDDVALDLGPGLNVLTGETGAGKSLLVDAVALLRGGRASSEVVRAGAEEARIEAVFEPGGLAPASLSSRLDRAEIGAADEGLGVRRGVWGRRRRQWGPRGGGGGGRGGGGRGGGGGVGGAGPLPGRGGGGGRGGGRFGRPGQRDPQPPPTPRRPFPTLPPGGGGRGARPQGPPGRGGPGGAP